MTGLITYFKRVAASNAAAKRGKVIIAERQLAMSEGLKDGQGYGYFTVSHPNHVPNLRGSVHYFNNYVNAIAAEDYDTYFQKGFDQGVALAKGAGAERFAVG